MKRQKVKIAEEGTVQAGGRRRLMDAALRIGAQKRSLQGLGLRELAREAGLNPNTFYRHFGSLEDLSLAIVEELGRDMRTSLRDIRRAAPRPQDVSPRTVEYTFDFALRNPDAFLVAVRELHGAMPSVSAAIRGMIAGVAEEMVEDVLFLELAPGLDIDVLRQLSLTVVQHVFHLTLDCLEQPQRRDELVRQTVRFIDMLFAGAITMQALQVDSLAELVARRDDAAG